MLCSTTSIVLSSNKPANPDSPGKMAVKWRDDTVSFMAVIILVVEYNVVVENGQVNDMKNITVTPSTGIDLEFDSDGKYLLRPGCLNISVEF